MLTHIRAHTHTCAHSHTENTFTYTFHVHTHMPSRVRGGDARLRDVRNNGVPCPGTTLVHMHTHTHMCWRPMMCAPMAAQDTCAHTHACARTHTHMRTHSVMRAPMASQDTCTHSCTRARTRTHTENTFTYTLQVHALVPINILRLVFVCPVTYI